MTQQPPVSKTDLMYEIEYNRKFVPLRSPRVSVKTTTEGNLTTHLMHNQETGQYYDLDEASKIIWDLTDGTRTIHDIIHDARASGKAREEDEVIEALLFFAESGALTSEHDTARKKRIQVMSSFETRVILIKDGKNLFGLAHRIFRPLLKGSLFWLSMALVLVAMVIFAPRFSSTFDDVSNFQILGSTVVGFFFYQFIVLGPVIAIHELSHGLALVHYGGRPGEIGTGMFYFGPMFYVDATDSLSLPRRERIMILWAGNLTTVLIGAVIVLVGLFVPYPARIATTLNMAAFWCFYSTLWQMAPPFETDGYYMLTDILNVPELRRDGFAYFKSIILHLFGRSSPEPQALTNRKRAVLLGYAVFSVVFVAYLAVQSLRFTIYMAADATSWAARVYQSTLAGIYLSPIAYAVSIVSIGYFAMSVSGYGVVVGKQLQKSLAGTLRFDALHDRHLSVFFFTPRQTPPDLRNRLERKVHATAANVTSNFSVGRNGSLLYLDLRMGGTSLPLSHVKVHLRRIEDRFYSAYKSYSKSTIEHMISTTGGAGLLIRQLYDMTDKTPPEARREVKESLREFLERQETTADYLLRSAFGTVWAIEIAPSQQYQLLEGLLPSILVSDLAMTSLAGQVEEFKKHTIYGLDSIGQLAAWSFKEQEEALAAPQRFQLVTSFEPIRGRIIFIGRTERIEKLIKELGPLFVIQVWAGYFDNLLSDVNLNLYSIVHSLATIPVEIGKLGNGELRVLEEYMSNIEQVMPELVVALRSSEEIIQPCRLNLRRLKTLFEPGLKNRVRLFDHIVELNQENLRSIPSRLKEFTGLWKKTLGWIESLKKPLEKERTTRRSSYVSGKKKIVKSYWVSTPLSALLVALGILQPTISLALALLAGAVAIQAGHLGAYYRLYRSFHKVPRHPSLTFTQVLTVMFALTQELESIALALSLLNPGEVLVSTGEPRELPGESGTLPSEGTKPHSVPGLEVSGSEGP